ncbi:UDP-phosphate galactose phosphotransferase [Sphingobium herbicidovorans NBRC 16415]|uniref:UDP-phosphate galactose phosphotransferase n=1 Tax=Sphingobium herbicidovorans (strain ATCC 700291 / DSM 11019 / CCUG 56400 / KCTC 2939 / LMG 18315 / NBRC 16415 / MH) TaxID=1219045 RepID=A0A086PAP9_SPHHM|nr:sugar transferase [Sphingobium herbicidovorans]KFG90467.1 UDP-phosphate galactose phosphotransferase [Sphingobium herbicidovorans NBRC 16415]
MGARRIADVMLASTGLVLLAPVMAIIAGSIRLFDGPPVLFKQARVTKGGKLFKVVKFRTMNDGRDAEGQLLPDRMRTTALGRFLRRSRLDELPQLWNILIGEMSLIGPRPLLPQTIAAAGKKGQLRCAVRPGLTGWAQVNGNSLLDDDDKIALDLWYIENRSLRIDLVILARTIGVALRGERFNLRLKGSA